MGGSEHLQSQHWGGRSKRTPRTGWGLQASQSRWISKVQVWWETLTQKLRWRKKTSDTDLWSSLACASAYLCVHTHTRMHTHCKHNASDNFVLLILLQISYFVHATLNMSSIAWSQQSQAWLVSYKGGKVWDITWCN